MALGFALSGCFFNWVASELRLEGEIRRLPIRGKMVT